MSEIYPVWWDTTITIYNRFEDKLTNLITWYKYTIDLCFWKNNATKIKVGDIVLDGNNIICRIPENANFRERYIWNDIPADEKGEYFTLGHQDIIIKGQVDDIINEYQQGIRSSDLKAKYKALQGCLEIDSYTINVGIGRNNPHYMVTGF